MASYNFFSEESVDQDAYTLVAVYCVLNLANSAIGFAATVWANLRLLSLFLSLEMLMTIFSTVASFSPLVLFHLLILLLAIQYRMAVARVSALPLPLCAGSLQRGWLQAQTLQESSGIDV